MNKTHCICQSWYSTRKSFLDAHEFAKMNWELWLDARKGFPVAVKCPKCGFISFPGYEQCKKCGHEFTQVNGQTEGIPPLFHSLGNGSEPPAVPEAESPLDQTELGGEEAGSLDVELQPQAPPPDPIKPELETPVQSPPPGHGPSPWQSDLADRVQEYRQRRARLQKEEESRSSALNLDFGPAGPKPEEVRPHIIEFPAGESSASRPKPKVGSAPPSFGMRSFESAFMEEEEEVEVPVPRPAQPPPAARPETAPLEIELGPAVDSCSPTEEAEPAGVAIAQMNMRFFAGLIDALVLLSGAGLYALIFWQVGGKFSLGPVQAGVIALVAAAFIFLYFTGCTAMASATPGLMWAGLEVITFEGNRPRFSDCLWRGFGYLVSISALMLGFIWAMVDAEGLTWHDRMSRTFIVPTNRH
ncbi:MAG: RDD family protein [Acidobacteria bacterium]|nr:MAG: RDD family protein [Acidobacteriota bacterium]